MSETIRYNCTENDNFIKFAMCLAKKNLKLPDEISIGNDADKKAYIIGFNDLCDAMLIAVGFDRLVEYLKQRKTKLK